MQTQQEHFEMLSLLCYFLLIQVVLSKYKVTEITVCPFLHLPMQVSCSQQEHWILPVSLSCLHERETEGTEMEPYIPLHLHSEGKVTCEPSACGWESCQAKVVPKYL